MLYKVKINLSKSADSLNKIGMVEMSKKPYWVSVEAPDPDDACAAAVKKVNTAINAAFSSLSISSSKVEKYTDEAIVNMRITEIKEV
tara:strand:- start:1609 stop:1869 length:261 start_codon:yes stop_codon:yes gene_type:complete